LPVSAIVQTVCFKTLAVLNSLQMREFRIASNALEQLCNLVFSCFVTRTRQLPNIALLRYNWHFLRVQPKEQARRGMCRRF